MLASDLGADGDPEAGREHWRAQRRAPAIESLLPMLEYVVVPVLVEGFYDVTPDHQPILGAVAGIAGLWLAAGFSGHGFMLAPAVGRRLAAADRAAATATGVLDTLALARFAERRARPRAPDRLGADHRTRVK